MNLSSLSFLSLSQCIPGYIHYLETGSRLLPGSQQQYAEEVSRFAADIGDPEISAITPGMLLDWHAGMREKGLAPGTFGLRHAAVVSLLYYLKRYRSSEVGGGEHVDGLLEAMRELRTPRDTLPVRKPFALDRETVQALLEGASAQPGILGVRDRAVVHMLVATGMRRAEVARLCLDDVDLPARTATVVGKGEKRRTIVWDEDCGWSLDGWLLQRRRHWPDATPRTVFLSATGGPMTPDNVAAVFKAAAIRGGVKKEVWTHLTRHSFVTSMLDSAMMIQDVAKLVGHNDVKTTLGYHHPVDANLRKAYDAARERSKHSKESNE